MKTTATTKLSKQAQAYFREWWHFDELESSNDWLIEQNRAGLICVAGRQTRGKGRRGRRWLSSDAGNLYFSFSFKLDDTKPRAPFSLLAGLAVCEALQRVGLEGHGLKWPNDIYCDEKKLGGILLESHNNLQLWIVGIGLNLSSTPAAGLDQPATCLAAHWSGALPEPDALVAEIVDQFVSLLESGAWQQQWPRWDMLEGRTIMLHESGHSPSPGVAHGVNAQGSLLVKLGEAIREVQSGEVSVRW